MAAACDDDGLAVCLVTGVVPQFLQEKVPAMLGGEAGLFSPPLDLKEEHSSSLGMRRSHRRSLGGKGPGHDDWRQLP